MAEIPTIPGSARVPDVQIGAKRNVQPRLQALAGVRQAAASATGAVQDVLGAVAAYEEKKRKAEETYTFNMASLGLQKLHTDYLHNAKAMPDEQIVPGWTQAANEYKGTTMDQYGRKLSPRAKQLLSMQMDQGIGEMTAKFQVLSDQFASERRKSAAVANFHEFLKSGDPAMLPKATASLDLAVKARDMTPEERNQYVDQGPAILQENQVRNGIASDAVKTLHKIDDGGYDKVPEQTLLALRRQAEAQVNRNQISKYQDIRKQQSEGKIYSRKDLNEMADREEIRGSSIDEILKAQAGEVKENDIAVNVSKVHDMILEIPGGASEDQRLMAVVKIHASKEFQSLPNEVKKDFDGALKQGKPQVEPIHKTQLQLMKSVFEERERMGNMPASDFRAKYGHGAKQPNAENERQLYAKAQQAYMEWSLSKKGQAATPQEASVERERLGFGEYESAADVKAAVKAGRIDRAKAKKILSEVFGISDQ